MADLTLSDVLAARQRIAPCLRPTQLAEAPALSETLDMEIRLKCESQQPIGAFKVRGGVSLVSAIQAGAESSPAGFCTASTGNHGQSIAFAARRFGYRAVVFAPEDCNPIKADSMRRLGAELVLVGRDFDEAREAAERAACERGYRFVHPVHEPLMVAGVATATLEIVEDWPDVEAIVVPIGAGSGACGACLVAGAVRPGIEVIGVQARGAPAFHNSWQSGVPMQTERADTFAEGVATRVAFQQPVDFLRGRLADLVLVSDRQIRTAMVELLRHAHQLSESAGAAALAAVRRPELHSRLVGRKVALMLSGANVTPEALRDTLDIVLPDR
ncbi:MAG: pyridoxal-phosphate dependent enzyme [Chloroflexi bacterium]|nr:pyridoxal-phosphate dependent enzyme [Chloroflexota bacterium]